MGGGRRWRDSEIRCSKAYQFHKKKNLMLIVLNLEKCTIFPQISNMHYFHEVITASMFSFPQNGKCFVNVLHTIQQCLLCLSCIIFCYCLSFIWVDCNNKKIILIQQSKNLRSNDARFMHKLSLSLHAVNRLILEAEAATVDVL